MDGNGPEGPFEYPDVVYYNPVTNELKVEWACFMNAEDKTWIQIGVL